MTIFNILDHTTELWRIKYIIGEFFSSGGATLYKNPSDQTMCTSNDTQYVSWKMDHGFNSHFEKGLVITI